jgi:hypothetical protein
VELYTHSPNTPSWRGAQLRKKHRDNFTVTLTDIGGLLHILFKFSSYVSHFFGITIFVAT